MSGSLKITAQILAPYKETIIDGGVVIIESVTRQVAEKQFYSLLSLFTGQGAVRMLKISFPFLNQTTVKVAQLLWEGDTDTLTKDFHRSQTQYMRAVSVSLNKSPTDLVTLHAGHFCKKGSLKAICQTLAGYSEFSDLFYVAAVPIVAPAISPLTTFSTFTIIKFAVGYLTTRALPPPDVDKNEVELDDFREKDRIDDWVVVEDDFKE